MSPWPILVTIHNVVNVPRSACENGPRSFVVEAHMVLRVSADSAPVATATFTTDDVVSTTPDLLEVRLDDATRCIDEGDEGGRKVWQCAVPELEVVVMVKEIARGMRGSSPFLPDRRAGGGDLDGTRVVGTAAPLRLNAKEIVEVDKLTTRIVGTEMGQVGLSFTVDPGDKAGYRQRLESFLRTHNPQGLRLVPSVVEAVSELDTFTKLYRRYSIQNYEERLASFFEVYGPQYKSEIPALLRQWEGREEELMRNLVLDNGPEVTTIDQHQRLTAYLATYQLDRNSRDVQEIFAAHSGKEEPGTSAALFSSLTERYGPEPDPRTYLFATPRYIPAPPSPPRTRGIPMGAVSYGHTHSSLHHGSPPLARSGAGENAAGAAAPRRCPPTPASERLYVSVPMSPTPIPNRKAPLQTARSLDRSPSFLVDDAPRRGGPKATMTGDWGETRPVITPKDEVIVSDRTVGASRRDIAAVRGSSLWRKMCWMMQTQQEHSKPWREHLLFFLDQDEFAAAVRALNTFNEAPDGGEVQALVGEWSRRVNQAFRSETLGSSDAYYEAAMQEAVRLTGLQRLHLQVMSISSLFHKEQYAGFAAYVEGQSKRAKTERLVLVGDSKRLMDVARFGIHAAADPVGDSGDGPASSSAAVYHASAGKGGGPFIFLRKPFRHSTEKHSCGLLVCDVAVGEMYSCPAAVHAPRQATADFLSKYDSCTYVDEANGSVVAVYSRQQVLPRLILQCIVDPQLQPCPAHPDRPVEYYVMESHAFACSRCVVMGAYKGKEVVTIEEAAAMARAGLAEVERTVNALKESMLAYANRLQNEENSVPTAPRRLEAEREIDQLQKEMEERIRRIRRQVQLEDEAELSRINAERIQVQETLEAVDGLGEKLTAAMHQRAPVAAVNALQHIQQEGQVEQLMARVQERVPSAPLELVLPLDGPQPTFPPRSSSTTKVRSKGSPMVMGLNESRLPEAAADERESHAPRAAAQHASRALSGRPTPHTAPQPSSLYAQYLEIAGSAGKSAAATAAAARGSSRPEQPNEDSSTVTLGSNLRPASVTASGESDGGGEMSSLSAKEALTRGWALLRRGDVAAAHRAWAAVCRAHGTKDVMGTKAHAYIAEAIEKDYAAAAHWYARSLQLDPQDRMTAYNYGVLLEALLDKPEEALRLYDRAAALGDAVAGARARELRSTLTKSSRQ
ncbi:hypothetical protein CUR178_07463 [Leishmania enriettii]|uniref:Uncharacterized protein n=1 Tax=Leishmania enriettii TaxID=5663 RepID=A0A836KWV9_LEIEN|nr:hypothetical protein CUR178_07463 [Leishmania enriettii]